MAEQLTVADLAAIFRVTEVSVFQWIKAGMPVAVQGKRGRGGKKTRLDLEACARWYFEANYERLELDRARARLANEQADRAALENAVTRDDLVPLSLIEREYIKTMRVERREKGEVRAGDFQCDPAIMVLNPELLVATLTEDVEFSAELTVVRGRGYVPASEHTDEDAEIGVIPVDALFSPVTRVRYHTEETRVGQRVNYDRLVMEIWTKGTTRPEDALVEAAKILRKHLNPFVQYFDLGNQVVAAQSRGEQASPAVDDELRQKLERPIATLDLSVRASNCLDAAKIGTVGELTRLTEHDLLQIRSFGKTSLMEVRQKLADLGLTLGMGSSPGEGADASETQAEAPATMQ